MARDYKREYEKSKDYNFSVVTIGTKIPKTLNEDFTAKVELEGVTKSAKIKELIENYTYSSETK